MGFSEEGFGFNCEEELTTKNFQSIGKRQYKKETGRVAKNDGQDEQGPGATAIGKIDS